MTQGDTRVHLRNEMKVLVACSECHRQFDASGIAAGSRFRCACGTLVRVPQVKAHDAAVVRCSACGAPRDGAGAECAYCGSVVRAK